MTDAAPSSDSGRIWTPSNVITLIRICLVPVFVIIFISPWPEWFGVADIIDHEAKALIAAGVFILISCTDWLDGYLARSRNEVTDFGKFMDPLADKILVAAALIALVELQVIPSWPVLIILTREFIVSGLRMLAASKGVVIAASWYGKAKTVAQIVAIILFLVKDNLSIPDLDAALHDPLYLVSWAVMFIALILTIASMLDYISKARSLLFPGKYPSSSRTASSPDDDGEEGTETGEEIAAEVVNLALEHAMTIATAESLTGGLIAATLTEIPGSSSALKGAVVSYTNAAKESLLDVDGRLLRNEGAVNAQTAEEMARGMAAALGVDVAISVTGIAGPTGAEPGKPIGTVYSALLVSDDIHHYEWHFTGNREDVRRETTVAALKALRSALQAS